MTGYPLYMVIGYIFAHLGFGSPAFSMNLLSALFGATACLGIYRLMRELWRVLFGIPRGHSLPFLLAAAAPAITAGLGLTWWDQSTQTEVYALMLVFMTFAWTLALRLIRKPRRKTLWTLALWSGLAFLHHLLFIITFPLSFLALLRYTTVKSRSDSWPSIVRSLLIATSLFALPLLGYLYLPVRAAAHPPVNWGNPTSLKGIGWHLSGGQYRHTRVLSRPGGSRMTSEEIRAYALARLCQQIPRWVGVQVMRYDPARLPRQYVLFCILLILAVLGLAALWRRSPSAAAGMLLGGLFHLVLLLIYTIPDIHVYQLPLWVFLLCLATAGMVAVPIVFPRVFHDRVSEGKHYRLRASVAAALLFSLGVFALANQWSPMLQRSEAVEPYRFAQALMNSLPQDAVVLTNADYDIFPLWYIQVCENQRPDVAVIGSNLIYSGWYEAMLRTNLPPDVKAFVRETPITGKGEWLVAFLGGTVAPLIQQGKPVYLTFYDPDIAAVYTLRRAFFPPSPYPPGSTPPDWGVYEVTDPNGSSKTAIQAFEQQIDARPEDFVSGEKNRAQLTGQ